MECTSPSAELEFKILVVIGTDCKGSCKSNYHTTTTDPFSQKKNHLVIGKLFHIKLYLVHTYVGIHITISV